MNGAIVSAENATIYQGFRNGVNMVMFTELNDGTFYAPAHMVDIIPEAFPEYSIREVYESEIKIIVKTRQQKIDELTTYLTTQFSIEEITQFLNDARNYMIDYVFGSDALFFWISSTDGNTWGDFSTTGLMSKSYGTLERQTTLFSILN